MAFEAVNEAMRLAKASPESAMLKKVLREIRNERALKPGPHGYAAVNEAFQQAKAEGRNSLLRQVMSGRAANPSPESKGYEAVQDAFCWAEGQDSVMMEAIRRAGEKA